MKKPRLAPLPRSNALRRVEMTDCELRAAHRALRILLSTHEGRAELGGAFIDQGESAMVEMRRAFGGRQ